MKIIILLSASCVIYTQVLSQAWNLTGNSGTNSSTNFIGTTDNKPFKIRTKNVVRVTVNSSGNVGIGMSSPVFKLEVKGGSINTDSVYRIGGNTVLSVKGSGNCFVGNSSGFSNTGNANTAAGQDALYSNTTGPWNTAIGAYALYSNITGAANTASGLNALYSNTTGWYNTATGKDALFFNTDGGSNTAYGMGALNYNISGDDNTAIGSQSLFLSTGMNNTGTGALSLFNTTSGSSNSAFGYHALLNNKTGNVNSAFGTYAFFDSLFLSNTTCMGFESGGIVNSSNRIEIGNSSVSVIAGQVGFSTYSDARIKDNVEENVPGINFISKLRPVTYNLNIHKENEMVYKGTEKDKTAWDSKYDIEKIKMTGFLAQEVEKAAKETGYDFSGVQKPVNPDELYSLRYSDFVMPLVKAVQELAAQNKEQDVIIENLKSEINRLKSGLKQSTINNQPSEILYQNKPNPFNSETEIKFQLPAKFNSAMLVISDENGKQIRAYNVQSANSIVINPGELSAGTYSYSLLVDGIVINSKQMVLTK